MVAIEINLEDDFNFSFERYCGYILNVANKADIVGIRKIVVYDEIPWEKRRNVAARYVRVSGKKEAIIEINLKIIAEKEIPPRVFEFFPEIAALWLSHTIFHEIGHHAFLFYRHGMRGRDCESFADNYARVGYLKYLNTRFQNILVSYGIASMNFFLFDQRDRAQFQNGIKEIISWRKKKIDKKFP